LIEVGDRKTLQETVNTNLVTIRNLTSKGDGLISGDISSSLDILDKIVTVTNRTGGGIVKEVHKYSTTNINYSLHQVY
jgi:hypothetical protein